MKFKIKNSCDQGFTLVEVLVAIGIFSIITVGATSLLLWAMHGRDVVFEQLSTQNEGRKAVQDFSNEVRRATASSIGAYPLQTAEEQQIIFYSNIDDDTWRERVRYFVSDRTLKKGILKPSGNPLVYNTANETITEVAHEVANGVLPIFSYYGENYDGVSNTSTLPSPINVNLVRIIGMKLYLDVKPNVSPEPLINEGKAEIRYFKAN